MKPNPKKIRPKMIKLTHGEIDSLVWWLKGTIGCPMYRLPRNSKFFSNPCDFCLNVVCLIVNKYPCPCEYFIDAARLPEIVIDLLEYNGYELPGNPEDYARIAG